MKIQIERTLNLNATIIDTRSPAEFKTDHIPGAINLPIFENKERHEIGKLYKANQEKAFDLGVKYYSKKLPELVSFIRGLSTNNTIVVYCWRGGMRSKAITQMIELMGYESYQLDGGYKAYRAYVREQLYNYAPSFKFIVLWGHTGTAKTRIIKKLVPAIDLEGLAQHRSSLFGAVGLDPRTQKMFESLLFFELEKHKYKKYVFIEGESQKIGNALIPNKLYKAIKEGINVLVKASIESRIKVTVQEYFKPEWKEDIKEVIKKLRQKLGKDNTEKLLEQIDNNDVSSVAKILLRDYYDPLYEHTVNNITYDFKVESDDEENCIQKLKDFEKNLD
ncbi:MAG: tRNA 2-selenouridine(34) synthase MnmH [Nanobdellota archaeon]